MIVILTVGKLSSSPIAHTLATFNLKIFSRKLCPLVGCAFNLSRERSRSTTRNCCRCCRCCCHRCRRCLRYRIYSIPRCSYPPKPSNYRVEMGKVFAPAILMIWQNFKVVNCQFWYRIWVDYEKVQCKSIFIFRKFLRKLSYKRVWSFQTRSLYTTKSGEKLF